MLTRDHPSGTPDAVREIISSSGFLLSGNSLGSPGVSQRYDCWGSSSATGPRKRGSIPKPISHVRIRPLLSFRSKVLIVKALDAYYPTMNLL